MRADIHTAFTGNRAFARRAVIRRAVAGAACGFAATVIMTGVLFAGQRSGAMGTLPARLIVEKIIPLPKGTRSRSLAAVAHLAYGSAAGSLFGALRTRSLAAGAVYGLLVWATSYEGWVPAADILPPAHRDSRPRALTILGAHVVYGLSLALLWRARSNRIVGSRLL